MYKYMDASGYPEQDGYEPLKKQRRISKEVGDTKP